MLASSDSDWPHSGGFARQFWSRFVSEFGCRVSGRYWLLVNGGVVSAAPVGRAVADVVQARVPLHSRKLGALGAGVV
jgi:hypothetical protein